MSGKGMETGSPISARHSELCAWRFGANAECDCKLGETCGHGVPFTTHCRECEMRGYCGCPKCEEDANG